METRTELAVPRASRPQFGTIADQVGNTPLVELPRILRSEKVRILAKLEWFNPGGSVKDRPALNMIQEAKRSGKLTRRKVLLDATSGNTGIALAMLSAALGYRVRLAVPANASPERIRMLRAYGAELDLTDPLLGMDRAVDHVRELAQSDPEKFCYLDQYSNPANWQAHYHSTGPEIISQTQGALDYFVCGVGTSGTLVGTSRRLKEHDPKIHITSFIPDSPMHGIEGLKHLPTAHQPAIYDPKAADEQLLISTEQAQELALRLALDEGLFAGTSSGAALAAALNVAQQIESGTIVVIFPDGGSKYLSQSPWGQL